MKGRIWTVPNQITLLRLGFLPIFLILISYEHYRWALAVLVVAGLSDGLHCLLARKLNQRSSLGPYLDSIPRQRTSQLSVARQRIAIMQNHECETHNHRDSRQPAQRIRDLPLAHVHRLPVRKYFAEHESGR